MAQDYKPADGTASPERPDYSADNIFEQSVHLQPVKQPANGAWGARAFRHSASAGLCLGRRVVAPLSKAGHKP